MAADISQTGETLPVDVFFDDLNVLGQVYYARYPVLVDRGLTVFCERMGLRLGHEDLNVAVRELTLTYDQPLRKVGSVDLTLWVEAVARTSVTFGFRFRTGDTVHAYGQSVIVKVERGTQHPASWTETTREQLTSRMFTGAIA
jgi:acyl-CoA thioesterase FadM